jgi:glycosyltransferase involved in cell wall biosynthesis
VILCSYPPLELSLAAVEYGRSNGVPVILDVRDLWPDTFAPVVPRGLGFIGRVAIRSLDRIARRACAGAFAIWGSAPSFMSWGVRHAGREPTSWDRYFPFGYVTTIPTQEEIAAARAQWAHLGVGTDRDEFIACFIGNVGVRHDVAGILDAAERLVDERGIKLVICGAGDRLEELRARGARLPNLIFSGWKRRVDVWTLLRLASVGIAPYDPSPDYIGSLSNKVPEYLSADLPVATNLTTGLLYDLLRERDCGFSYGGDPARLAATLTELRNDPERLRQLRKNATAVFEEQFRAERVYADMIAVLEEIVNATRQHGQLARHATSA